MYAAPYHLLFITENVIGAEAQEDTLHGGNCIISLLLMKQLFRIWPELTYNKIQQNATTHKQWT